MAKIFAVIVLILIVGAGFWYWQVSKTDEQVFDNSAPGEPCIQVITRARNPQTGEEKDFPTPCDVPEGWVETAADDTTLPEETAPAPAPEPQAPAPSAPQWKTFKSPKYNYEFQYPSSWGIQEQLEGLFVDLGEGTPQPGSGDIAIDLVCVYQFEVGDPNGGGEIRETKDQVTYGDNIYTEQRFYETKGGEEVWKAQGFFMDYPSSFAENHSYNDDSNFFKDQCRGIGIYPRKLLDQSVLSKILSSFKFN